MNSDNTLSQECQYASYALEKLVDKFNSTGWEEHARYIKTMASHLQIYSRQIEGKAAHGIGEKK